MSHKKLLNLFAASSVLALAILVAFTLSQGAQFKSVIYGVFLLTMYVLLIASYLSRVALVFLVVFAAYKVLRERVNASNKLV
jgi:uncharacterized membrane protein